MGTQYQALHKYLHDRFADRIVLTFSEIEDLVGFRLPDEARDREAWWVSDDAAAPRSAVADAWTLARAVTFDANGRRR